MASKKLIPKTEKKISFGLNNEYRSLTSIKSKGQTLLVNAESVSPCLSKKCSAVSTSSESLKDQLLGFLEDLFSSATCRLLNLMQNWLDSNWKSLRMQISNRLSKLKYLEPSLINQTYSAIEKQIVVEWKKNTLLVGLQLLWNHVFLTESFQNLKQIQIYYNTLRNLILQLTYTLFKQCLDDLSDRQINFQEKIYHFTAVTIITSNKQWKQIVNKVIKPHFFNTSPSFSENYNLEDLNARKQLIDLSTCELLFKQTSSSISRLQESYSLLQIISSLKEYRSNLLNEIQKNIDDWRRKNNSNKQIVLQKEDILACIIYTLVKHKLDNIGVSLKYISFLLGNQIEMVLGLYQVDCYRVDLDVAVEYLTQPVVRLSIDNFDKHESTTFLQA